MYVAKGTASAWKPGGSERGKVLKEIQNWAGKEEIMRNFICLVKKFGKGFR